MTYRIAVYKAIYPSIGTLSDVLAAIDQVIITCNLLRFIQLAKGKILETKFQRLGYITTWTNKNVVETRSQFIQLEWHLALTRRKLQES